MTAPGVGLVLLLALLTAVATGLGALPFLFVRDLTRDWLGVSDVLASGLMLAASFGLVYEDATYGLWRMLLGVTSGLGFIVLTRALLRFCHERCGGGMLPVAEPGSPPEVERVRASRRLSLCKKHTRERSGTSSGGAGRRLTTARPSPSTTPRPGRL